MRVYFDLETEPIADDNRLPRPVVCGYSTDSLALVGIVQGTSNIIAHLEHYVREGATLYAHNGAHFDFPVLAFWSEATDVGNGLSFWADAAHSDRLVCTSVAATLHDIATIGAPKKDMYPLARTCRDFGIDVPLDKSSVWRTRYQELEHAPLGAWPGEARVYLENDVRALHELAQRLPLPPDTHRKTEQHFWLELSSFNGAPTNAERARAWGDDLRAKMLALAPRLERAHLIDSTGKKNTKAMRLAICGLDTSEYTPDEIAAIEKDVSADPPPGVALTPPSKKFPRGQIKTDAIACEDSESELMALVTEYNSLGHTLSNEWPIVMQGRVHTQYGIKKTGRTSSAKPALQNLGNGSMVRECFIAEPGAHLCIADWTMLELCCLGQLCVTLGAGSNLAQALRDGRDIHAELAQSLARAGGFGDDPKTLRRLAKEANFGRGGGMGAETLRETARKRGLRFDIPTAQALVRVHSAQWPEIAVYHRRVQQHLDSSDTITHYHSGRKRRVDYFTAAANTLFQGLGADVALEGFVAVARSGFLPQLFVHDEYHWSLREPGETETIRDVLRAVSARILPHCPSRIDPVIVSDWSAKK